MKSWKNITWVHLWPVSPTNITDKLVKEQLVSGLQPHSTTENRAIEPCLYVDLAVMLVGETGH